MFWAHWQFFERIPWVWCQAAGLRLPRRAVAGLADGVEVWVAGHLPQLSEAARAPGFQGSGSRGWGGRRVGAWP